MTTIFYRRRSNKPETSESAFRNACIDLIKIRFGRYVWHYRHVGSITDGKNRSLLDDHFIIRGVPVQIEFKRPDGQYRKNTKTYRQQEKEIEDIRRAGGRAGFVGSYEELNALLVGIEPVQLGMRTQMSQQ